MISTDITSSTEAHKPNAAEAHEVDVGPVPDVDTLMTDQHLSLNDGNITKSKINSSIKPKEQETNPRPNTEAVMVDFPTTLTDGTNLAEPREPYSVEAQDLETALNHDVSICMANPGTSFNDKIISLEAPRV